MPFVVPAALAQALRSVAEREGATLFTILLAAYQVFLSKYSMQDEVLVGAPMAGRSRKEFAPVVGYFVNPVVLRGRLGDNPPFVTHLQRTRRAVADALEHQDVPFPLLVERLKPHREAGRSPLFQAMFSLQRTRDEAVRALASAALGVAGDPVKWETLTLEACPLPRRIAQFDLALDMAEAGGTLIGSLEYAADLFHAETAAQMAEHFVVLLRSIVADPATAGAIAVAGRPPMRRSRQLDLWNRTDRAYPPAATVLELWQRQVVSQPDALRARGGRGSPHLPTA